MAAFRLRGWAMKWLRDEVFSKVDVYVTPATAVVAPQLTPAAMVAGESDALSIVRLMRFIFLGNLCGNPGMVSPVGYDDGTGLPIGLHMLADHWGESVLLRAANALQHHVPHRTPPHFLPRDA